MKIVSRTDFGYTIEVSQYELSVMLGYNAQWKPNDTIIPTKALEEYNKVREELKQISSIIKLEKK